MQKSELTELIREALKFYQTPEQLYSGSAEEPSPSGMDGAYAAPGAAQGLKSTVDILWSGFSPETDWREGLGFAAAIANYMAVLEERDLIGFPPLQVSEAKRYEFLARTFTGAALKGYQTSVRGFMAQGLKTLGLTQKAASHFSLVADVASAVVIGLTCDLIALRGFDSIDHLDLREWLKKHGAKDETVNSQVVNPGYDYAFAYENGDTVAGAGLAAGVAVNAFLRLLLTYRGALFYEMQAAMGEVIFTPLYDVLRARGVEFKFFHRVDALNVGLQLGKPFIKSVKMGIQTKPKNEPYQPLINFEKNGNVYRCWPAKPNTEQLERGDQLEAYLADCANPPLDHISSKCHWPDAGQVELKAGLDYDQIVLAIPIGEFGRICLQLIEASPEWDRMVKNVKTVGTIALQLWLNKTTCELGWEHPPALMTSFAQPLNTWADMSHLKKVERWQTQPQSIAYFCGPLRDPDNSNMPPLPPRQTATGWSEQLCGIWPALQRSNATPPAGTDDRTLGFEEVITSVVRANDNPPDRYVLTLPGSTQYRLRTDQSGFANLYLAGDWIRSGMNVGCLEAAMLSGVQAGRAIKSPDGKLHDPPAEKLSGLVDAASEAVEELVDLAEAVFEAGAEAVIAVADALAASACHEQV